MSVVVLTFFDERSRVNNRQGAVIYYLSNSLDLGEWVKASNLQGVACLIARAMSIYTVYIFGDIT
jgi:hypothetical protein